MEKKKKILLIDDNIHCYQHYLDVLRQDYDVSVSDTLSYAVMILKSIHFDLVIVDIMMPTYGSSFMNEYCAGLDFYYYHIRLKYPTMKVIAWSAAPDLYYDYIRDKGGKQEFSNLYFVEKGFYKEDKFKAKVRYILSL